MVVLVDGGVVVSNVVTSNLNLSAPRLDTT